MSAGAVGDRPGGLTALAVINFIFGGFELIGVLGNLGNLNELRLMYRVFNYPEFIIYLGILLSFISATLAITAGVGYLKLRKGLGWVVGNVYGILGLISAVINMTFLTFNLAMIILLVYPVMTLVLLNTTFREDFALA